MDIFTIRAGASTTRWNEKDSRAFWRGRDSRQERLDLVFMSKQRPDLIDAALTNMFFYTDSESVKKYGPLVNRTSFYEFFKVTKILLNIYL